MAKIQITSNTADDREKILSLCPFGAIKEDKGSFVITPDCRLCMLCVKNGPKGMFVLIKDEEQMKDLSGWKDIFVFGEIIDGSVHPVSLELVGKARELAAKVSQKVTVILIGDKIEQKVELIRQYGVDRIIAYSDPALKYFLIEPYTAILEEIVKREQPGIMLFGGTVTGRSLAPRLAARVRTGLTADCTRLDIQSNADLDQIRPAFGGNIMAHIRTTRHRPQLATVRYKIFDKPREWENPQCRIEYHKPSKEAEYSRIEILEVKGKKTDINIEDAEVIIALGNGFRKKEDLAIVSDLANLLDAKVAGSRPVIEKGWIDPRNQIGLSGRTVRPKLIITCGISGSVQFIAGMQGSETIIAINKDETAPIFKIAHHGFVGDLYSLLPEVTERIVRSRGRNGL